MKGAREVKQKKKKKIGERKKQRNKWRVKLRPVLVVCCEQTLESKLIHLRDRMMMIETAIRNVGRGAEGSPDEPPGIRSRTHCLMHIPEQPPLPRPRQEGRRHIQL